MRLIERYDCAIQQGDIEDDVVQRQLLVSLQALTDIIEAQYKWYVRFLYKKIIKGVYIVGPVGVGKTFLMNLFYQNVVEKRKKRIHFLSFMQQIDAQLRLLQGQVDPVLLIAKALAKECRVLCVDEWMVEDVAHAMILSKLMPALIAHKVVLVMTSNTKIDDLYRNGIQRERFLPVIALLHQYCTVFQMRSATDYRLGRLADIRAYLYPLSQENQDMFAQQFQHLAGQVSEDKAICIQNRMIPIIHLGQGVIWFDFQDICSIPRCQLDYIELANRFHTVCISNMPVLSQLDNHTAVVLFIQLVDVFYDRNIRLLLTAAVAVPELYVTGPLMRDISRTLSRLEEMKSADYLSINKG